MFLPHNEHTPGNASFNLGEMLFHNRYANNTKQDQDSKTKELVIPKKHIKQVEQIYSSCPLIQNLTNSIIDQALGKGILFNHISNKINQRTQTILCWRWTQFIRELFRCWVVYGIAVVSLEDDPILGKYPLIQPISRYSLESDVANGANTWTCNLAQQKSVNKSLRVLVRNPPNTNGKLCAPVASLLPIYHRRLDHMELWSNDIRTNTRTFVVQKEVSKPQETTISAVSSIFDTDIDNLNADINGSGNYDEDKLGGNIGDIQVTNHPNTLLQTVSVRNASRILSVPRELPRISLEYIDQQYINTVNASLKRPGIVDSLKQHAIRELNYLLYIVYGKASLSYEGCRLLDSIVKDQSNSKETPSDSPITGEINFLESAPPMLTVTFV
jgi:hypothetical protein